MSFLISATPPFVVCLVFPTGAPESTKLAIFFFIHTSHSPILFFLSSALVLAIIFRISPMSILYNTKNFFMRFRLCWLLMCPSLYANHPRCSCHQHGQREHRSSAGPGP